LITAGLNQPEETGVDFLFLILLFGPSPPKKFTRLYVT